MTAAAVDTFRAHRVGLPTSREMRSNHPHNRKDDPMQLDTCVSRAPNSTRKVGYPPRFDRPFERGPDPAKVGAGPARRPTELAVIGTGWSPDRGRQLGMNVSYPRVEPRTALRAGSGPTATVTTCAGAEDSVAPLNVCRNHLNAQLRAGRTIEVLAELIGCDPADLRSLRRHNPASVDPGVAAAVLDVPFGPCAGEVDSPGIGVLRRLRALVAMGYSARVLAEHLHAPEAMLSRLTVDLPGSGLLPTRLWFAVERLYDALSMTPGPDEGVRDDARAAGWATPLAWDDDEIDDPRSRPHAPSGLMGVDTVAVARRIAGDRTAKLGPDDVEVVLATAERQGWETQRLAFALDSSVETASRRLRRYRDRMRAEQVSAAGEGVEVAVPVDTGSADSAAAPELVAAAESEGAGQPPAAGGAGAAVFPRVVGGPRILCPIDDHRRPSVRGVTPRSGGFGCGRVDPLPRSRVAATGPRRGGPAGRVSGRGARMVPRRHVTVRCPVLLPAARAPDGR